MKMRIIRSFPSVASLAILSFPPLSQQFWSGHFSIYSDGDKFGIPTGLHPNRNLSLLKNCEEHTASVDEIAKMLGTRPKSGDDLRFEGRLHLLILRWTSMLDTGLV